MPNFVKEELEEKRKRLQKMLSSIFKENPHLPPSAQYKKDLNTLDSTSFASGNLTRASVTKMAYQKLLQMLDARQTVLMLYVRV